MALAAAFNVEVLALSVGPSDDAARRARRKHHKVRAALRLSLWIHLAGYAVGMVTFAGIGLGLGQMTVMLWPAIWWSVGAVSHSATVVIVDAVTRYKDETA